jgi:putative hemolysin
MKKAILFLIVLSLFVGFSAFAAETDTSANETLNVASPTVLPNSPFYFLKEIGRNIQTFLTVDPVKKAELKLKFANEKLVEAEKVSETSDATSTDKALDNYQKEVEKVKQSVEVLVKDNPNSEKLLEKIAENNINHQQILDKIAENKVEVEGKIGQVKEKVIENFTNGTFELASPEKAKAIIEKVVGGSAGESSQKVEILNKIVEKAPEAAKKALVEVQSKFINSELNNTSTTTEEKQKLEQSLSQLKEKNEYKEIMVENVANKIVSGTEDSLKTLNISQTDMAQVKEFAQKIISGETIDYGKVISGINNLNVTNETQKIITNLIKEEVAGSSGAGSSGTTPAVPGVKSGTGATQPAVPEVKSGGAGGSNAPTASSKAGMANPASTFCVKNGYKIEIRKNADGSEYGVCIFNDGKECEEWAFYRKECGAEYIK